MCERLGCGDGDVRHPRGDLISEILDYVFALSVRIVERIHFQFIGLKMLSTL
ncbi:MULTISPECIES: hypothetical protein [Leucobacter]|uniref:hypothetical protein n=1 Tax=Leucobacter TaxID=55968 RepID=UPI00210696C6|nr:hypothetical protein [Leucobacter aridicollis]UTX52465.1 hypothetical protein KI794_12030 [Leucobacter aridicollis]